MSYHCKFREIMLNRVSFVLTDQWAFHTTQQWKAIPDIILVIGRMSSEIRWTEMGMNIPNQIEWFRYHSLLRKILYTMTLKYWQLSARNWKSTVPFFMYKKTGPELTHTGKLDITMGPRNFYVIHVSVILYISSQKTIQSKTDWLQQDKFVCYIRYFVRSDLFISSFHCTFYWLLGIWMHDILIGKKKIQVKNLQFAHSSGHFIDSITKFWLTFTNFWQNIRYIYIICYNSRLNKLALHSS